MSKILKRNFEPGRLLLVVTLLMSLALVSQLYVISESFDISNGFQLSGIELSLTASYVLTSLSMVIVINEFFQIKTKVKGLIELSHLINNDSDLNAAPNLSPSEVEAPGITKLEIQKISEKELDEELEFEKLLEDDLDNEPVNEEEPQQEKPQKAWIDETAELEPLIEEDELQGVFDKLEEEELLKERLLSESEVIATLAELEELVEELKRKRMPVIAQ